MMVSEFSGGLGDVISQIYNSKQYTALEHLPPTQKAMVILMSHNPHVKELFHWHPNAAQFDIRDVGFWWPLDDPHKRSLHRLPPAQPFHIVRQMHVTFFPSPEDLKILSTLGPTPYLVINAGAGTVDRNLPMQVCEDALELIAGEGFRQDSLRAIAVGSTYSLGNRKEPRLPDSPLLTNLVDRLSVPGTIELIRKCVGVLCCFSAMCLAAWYLNKPVFLTYPQHVKRKEFDRPANHYTFGRSRPTTMHMDFATYKKSALALFLRRITNFRGTTPNA